MKMKIKPHERERKRKREHPEKVTEKKGGVCGYLVDQVTSDVITVFKIDSVLLCIKKLFCTVWCFIMHGEVETHSLSFCKQHTFSCRFLNLISCFHIRYFLLNEKGEKVEVQLGVVRTNCIDCLDRTNVTQVSPTYGNITRFFCMDMHVKSAQIYWSWEDNVESHLQCLFSI